MQMLHCIKQADKGGESILVDGFKVAYAMKARHPANYETLVNTPVNFTDEGKQDGYQWHYKLRVPTFE